MAVRFCQGAPGDRMFNVQHLFSSCLYKTKIDPCSFNKADIVATLKRNYYKGTRNNWDPESDLHHLYDDWSNPNFEEVDFSQVILVYLKLVSDFLATQKFSVRFNYDVIITNATVYAESQHMSEHDHIEDAVIFTGVHYISAPKNCSPLTFVSPLLMMQYNPHPAIKLYNELFDYRDVNNSVYYKNYNLQIEEDDFIIFPAYLRHKVLPNPTLSDLRMAIVINIKILDIEKQVPVTSPWSNG